MLKRICFLMILLSLISAGNSWAIQGATGDIRNGAFTDQFSYTIEIYLKSDAIAPVEDFNLGTTKLTVNYNNVALSAPVLSNQNPTFNNNAEYGAMTLDTTTPGEVGVQINPAGVVGTQLPRTEILLAKITFAIDPGQLPANAGISADQSPFSSFVSETGGAPGAIPRMWIGSDNRDMTCAPDIDGSPDVSATVGHLYSFTPTEIDVCGATTYGALNLPVWATIDTATGELSGTPAAADIGTYLDVEVTVADNGGTDTVGSFDIQVSTQSSGSSASGSGGGGGGGGGCFIKSLFN